MKIQTGSLEVRRELRLRVCLERGWNTNRIGTGVLPQVQPMRSNEQKAICFAR